MFKFLSYNKNFSQKQNEYDKLLEKIAIANKQYDEIQKKLNIVNSELKETENIIEMTELGMEYIPYSSRLTDIQKKINKTQKEIANLIGNNNCTIITRVYKINDCEKKGQSFQNNYCKNLLIGFNSYCKSKEKSITAYNYYKNIDLIKKAFNNYNKMGDLIGVSINPIYLNLQLKIIQLKLDEKIVKEKEKNQIKEEKRKLKEQNKLLEEAEKTKKKLEEERKNLQKLFAKAITEKEQEEIRNKLFEVDKRVEEVDWRISHYSAGWLYITTTPSMPGIYKCGCTKQLNPLNRLAQLSSASVPFPFECRGLVFSEDVFALEAKVHNRLNSKRVNKENKLKEFFFGEPEEAIKILTEDFNEEVRFINEQWIENEEENNNEID